MADQQYSLQWNNHQQNFNTIFKSMLDSEELVDVTLSVEGKHIKAHKVVLSARSPYFKLLFSTTPGKHPIVIISDVKYSDLKTVIEFMYCGKISVYNEQLTDFLGVAETLEITGLYYSKQKKHSPENVSGCSNNIIERNPECNSPGVNSNSRGSEHHVDDIGPEIQSHHQTYREECEAKLDGNRSVQNDQDGMESNVKELSTKPIIDVSPYVPMSVSNSGRPGRPVKDRNSENFLLALEAVRSGLFGFCKAAKIYGVNNRTLWLEYKKRGYPSLRPPVGIRKNDV